MNEYYKKDLYKILEVEPESDVAKIKAAYRKQARIWHPDVNENSKESILRFKEITEAYEVLTDTQKRNQYDIIKGFNTRKEYSYSSSTKAKEQTAKKAYSENNTKSQKNSSFEQPKTEPQYQTNKKQEEKGSFSQVFENILDGIFTTNSTKTQKSKQGKQDVKQQKTKIKAENGKDINLNVNIKMAESIVGTNRTINVLHTERCPKCDGRRFINGNKCPLCKGSGEISVHKKLNVKIPAGIKKGAKIRVANEGNKGYNGGKNGDLYLHIEIEETPFFKYEGLNVICEVPITPFEAVLGTNIDIPTLCGNISMKIPPNTTTGQKFRLSEQGVYDAKKHQKGDQIVTVKIVIPPNLSTKEIELYEQLKKISTTNVRENLLND